MKSDTWISFLVHTFDNTRKLCLTQDHQDFLLFSFTNFTVVSFTFKIMIHFELVFVYAEAYEVHFLRLALQLVQCGRLKRLSFLLCISFASLVRITCPFTWIYFWTFYSVSLIHLSIFIFLQLYSFSKSFWLFHVNFRISLLILQKSLLGFWLGVHWL